jgi:hypothetical protein
MIRVPITVLGCSPPLPENSTRSSSQRPVPSPAPPCEPFDPRTVPPISLNKIYDLYLSSSPFSLFDVLVLHLLARPVTNLDAPQVE